MRTNKEIVINYSTKQKKLILSVFEKNPDVHLTVEEISIALKNQNTPVSVATIYRNVSRLINEGLVRKYTIDKTKACYQFAPQNRCHEHFHLKCTKCGELFHASCPYLSGIEEHIFNHHSFKIDQTRTVFYGLCEKCNKQ